MRHPAQAERNFSYLVHGEIYHGLIGYLLSHLPAGEYTGAPIERSCMGKIELIDGYFIEIDPLNFTLKQKYAGKKQDGADRTGFRLYGYYPTLKSALKRFSELVRMDEMGDAAVSLSGYVDLIEKADKKVMDFLERLDVHYEDS